MLFWRKILDWLLYSNVFIGICAAAMASETFLLHRFSLNYFFTPIIGLIFFSTVSLYTIHRLIALAKLPSDRKNFEKRFEIIARHKKYIVAYGVFATLSGGILLLTGVSRTVQAAILLPALLSLGYAVPFLGEQRKKRLRDVDGLKIFLIAAVWAYVTVLLPLWSVSAGGQISQTVAFQFFERFCFVFAICIPFDIRDLQLDASLNVRTLPSILGIRNALWLSVALLMVSGGLVFFVFPLHFARALLFSNILTSIFTLLTPFFVKNDYFFGIIMDGSILLRFLLVLAASFEGF